MPLERNLFPNPNAGNNGTGWASVSGSYSRFTGGTAGKLTDGASTSLSSANRLWVSQTTPAVAGTLISGTARIWLDAAGSSACNFVVFADSAGEPGALLATSDTLAITNTTEQAITFTFSGGQQIAIASGTSIWVGVAWVDPGTPSLTFSRDNTATSRREQSWTPPTIPNPFGTPLASNTGPIDAYITVGLSGMPRSTGWTGTVADDSNTPRAQVTAGEQYVYSVTVQAIAAQTFNMLVNFYSASSGGTFIGNSGSSVPVALSAAQTQRYIMGPYTVPAGAVSSHLKFNDIDAGGVRITAVRCTPYSGNLVADGAVLDGATPGAVWDGAAEDSTSTKRSLAESVFASDAFGVVATAVGPVFSESVLAADAFAGLASGTFADNGFADDGFVIAQLEFDQARGRIRVSAFTFAEGVTHVRVRRRLIGGKWEDVRGGVVDTFGGYMVRPVDDYEYPAGRDVEYEIAGLTDTETVRQSAIVRRFAGGDSLDHVWLKFVANPQQNRRVDLVGWGEQVRPSRSVTFDVVGRQDPVVVTDVHGSRRVTVKVVTHSVDDTKSLDDALSQGYPVYFQVPYSLQLPTLYAVVGDYSIRPLKQSSVRSMFELPLTEVSAPPASIVPGGTRTYAALLTEFQSYAALFDGYDTYRQLVIGGD